MVFYTHKRGQQRLTERELPPMRYGCLNFSWGGRITKKEAAYSCGMVWGEEWPVSLSKRATLCDEWQNGDCCHSLLPQKHVWRRGLLLHLWLMKRVKRRNKGRSREWEQKPSTCSHISGLLHIWCWEVAQCPHPMISNAHTNASPYQFWKSCVKRNFS